MTETLSAHPNRRGVLLAGALAALPASAAEAANARDLSARAAVALETLYGTNAKARELGRRARAVLVFPEIVKAGLVVGGQEGEGAMRVEGRTTAFYRIAAASFGLQAGIQKFSYALFFITDSALDYLTRSRGWSIGSGPSVVIVDEGFARTINTTTLTQDVYAMAFGQHGLMAGAGLEGSKITQIYPDP